MSFPNVVHASAENGIQYNNLSTKKYPLGQKMELEDGRIFRHVLNGGTLLVRGDVIQGKAVVSGDYTDLSVDSAAAVGDTTVTFTSATTTAADYYNDGWLHVNKTATAVNKGDAYRILDSPLLTSGAGDVITLYTNDPIRTAIAASDEIGLTPDPYNGVIQAVLTTLTSMVVGVAVYPLTAAYYGWVQTRGMCPTHCAASTVVGNYVSAILAAAGQAGVCNTDIDTNIGIVMSVCSTAGEPQMLYLVID